MSEEKEIRDMTEQELKSAIAEVTIKIKDQEGQKKNDAAMHNDAIADMRGEQTLYIDEIKLRRTS